MSTKRCYYETLEVERGANGDMLKSAYRKMAMRFHPDKNPGDHTAEIKFKEINEAYDVLKDDQKRAAYDRFGHAAFEGGMGAAGARAGASPFGDFAGGFGDVFEDIFGQMMGGMGRAKRSNRGQDLRYNLDITLEEAFTGRAAEIKVPTAVTCDSCSGSGAEPGHSAEMCPTCAGTARYAPPRASSPSSAAARPAAAPARSSAILQDLQRRRPGAEERTLNVDVPPRRRGRHAHPPQRRGRGGGQWRAAGRPLYLPVGGRASHLPARTATTCIAAPRCRS